MDLSLHLGGPVDALTRSMPEAELQRWSVYAGRHLLPFRRLEILLAQLAMIVARTMGGAKDAKVADFMLKEPEDLPGNVTRIETARQAFGFAPRRKKA
jgi:hypothetical protein